MPNPETGPQTPRPNELPPDLAAFLTSRPSACLLMPTDQGTVMVIKLPGADIDSARARVPIQIRHELYQYPLAPVIRMVRTIYDRPHHPLALETFIDEVTFPPPRSAVRRREPTSRTGHGSSSRRRCAGGKPWEPGRTPSAAGKSSRSCDRRQQPSTIHCTFRVR